MLEMLTQALQEERYAEALYTRILSEHEAPDAFGRAVAKEAAHSVLLERLYLARGLRVPASTWTAASVPSYASLQDACRAALHLEQSNVARYDVLLEMWGNELPVDLRDAFTTFRRESEQQHLPVVQGCAEG
jgi:rubrerythrin